VLANYSSFEEIKMTEILAFLALYFGFGSPVTPSGVARPPDILFSTTPTAAQPPGIFFSPKPVAPQVVQPPEIF
jgi:hypothetical protein